MTEQNGTPTAPRNPDSIITTQRNGQTIVAELFFNHSSTETFRDKLLKAFRDAGITSVNGIPIEDFVEVGDYL